MAKSCVIALLLLGLIAGSVVAANEPAISLMQAAPDAHGAPPKDLHPLFENFELGAFPPAGWSVSGTSGLWWRSTACSGRGSGAASAMANFLNNAAGVTQTLISVTCAPTVSGDSLRFEHAYATNSTERDSLAIYASVNGGANWTLLAGLGGGTSGPLNTGGATSIPFVPASDQWASKSYALPAGTNKVELTAISAHGNRLYLDNTAVPQAHDVGINGSSLPAFSAPGTAVTPQVTVKNFGRNTEAAFPVICRIERVDAGGAATVIDADTQTVASLAAGAASPLSFPPWIAAANDAYRVTIATVLASDQTPANDAVMSFVRAYTSPKKPLGELETNTGCGPCVAANDTINAICHDLGDGIVLIRYHSWWPSSADPFYNANVPENVNRINYYGGRLGVPNLIINGTVAAGYDTYQYRTLFNDEIGSDRAPFTMALSGSYDSIANEGLIRARVTATGRIVDEMKLRYAIVEDSIFYTGSNGDPRHDQVFRQMLPDTLGQTIVIDRGNVVTDSQAFTIDAAWKEKNCRIVAFVQTDMQNEAQKTVFQSEWTRLLAIPNGAAGAPAPAPAARADLMPISPNPITGTPVFSYTLAAAGRVKLGVYDIAGRLVARVVDGNVPAGHYTVAWNGQNCNGQRIASGVYFVRLDAAGATMTRRVTIIR